MIQERLGRYRRKELSPEDLLLKERIEQIGEISRELGLDPFPIYFEKVPAQIMYEFGSYGLPGRFSHWTHGKAYHQLKTRYDYGLSKIYELVINSNPSYAFLLENNTTLQNMLVAAHVVGHVDFFKNSISFRETNRKMTESAPLHADRIRQYEFEHGKLVVEKFLDDVLAIQWNIDPVDLKRLTPEGYRESAEEAFKEKQKAASAKKTDYDDLFEQRQQEERKTRAPVPFEEEEDLLYIIGAFSPVKLEDWQKDIIDIVRSETQYFLPQAKTKIMNEGWATYWHLRILREMEERGLLTSGEELDWREMHSRVASPAQHEINPYFVGWKIWEDITRVFKGEPHPENKKTKTWWGETVDTGKFAGQSQYDVFWIRETITSDTEFIRNYLTDYLIEDLDLYSYELDEEQNVWKIKEKDPKKVKEAIMGSLVNFGQPVIKVAVGGIDYNGNQELYLVHKWEGQDLDMPWAEKTLACIRRLWGKKVHLETTAEEKRTVLICKEDGTIERKTL